MQLPGNLRATTLGDVLGALHRSGQSGTLELVEDGGAFSGRSHRVHLKRGLVESVETEMPTARLGEILLRKGFIDKHALERLLLRALSSRVLHLGQMLLRERVISEDALAAALRFQLRRKLDALFALRGARILFRVPRHGTGDARRIPLSPREFLHGRPRFRVRSDARRGAHSLPHVEAEALGILGLDSDATPEAIRQAFRSLALKNHPDRYPDATPAEKHALILRFAELSAAYHKLLGS